MLDMFKRKTHPEEHNSLYAIPASLMSTGLLYAYTTGAVSVFQMGY
jgi:hypothetical protein